MEPIVLVPVSQVDIHELEAYRAAFPAGSMQATPNPEHIPGLDSAEDFDSIQKWLHHTRTMAGKISWYASLRQRDLRMVGVLCLRHDLAYDDEEGDFASHIGYSIRPDAQGEGYGREQLRLGLQAAARQGLASVRIICRDVNIASRQVILACGGVYRDTLHGEESGMNVCLFDVVTGG